MGDELNIETERLLLRRFSPSDVPTLVNLAGAKEIAATTARIPHPYTDQDAFDWLQVQARMHAHGTGVPMGVILKGENTLIGAVGLELASDDQPFAKHRGELGYWIGVSYWGNGYATEAARAMIAYGFESLGLSRIYAQHMSSNPASGRILTKLGMTNEGMLRQHHKRFGSMHDMHQYGILRDEWEASRRASS